MTDAKKIGAVERIPYKDVQEDPTVLDRRELKMVGEIAKATHEHGCKFDDWPVFERVKLKRDGANLLGLREVLLGETPDVIEIRGSVIGWPR
jgi:hypothetical protein